MKYIKIGILAFSFLFIDSYGLSFVANTGGSETIREQTSDDQRVLIAKAKKRKKKKKDGGARKKILTGEKRYKSSRKRGESTTIDFDEASIDGQRKTPMGMSITKNRPDQEYDLIKLRLEWHPEMVQSASRLETGKGR